MLAESWISARHDAVLRARGAVEPPDDVFRWMQVVYPGGFMLMIAEAWLRGAAIDRVFYAGLALFAAAKLLKYWAIATLGERWTFRVLVPPQSSRVTGGPYRWLTHPNYLAVIGELAGCAVMAHALITGPLATLLFAWLIRRRIAVEERALGMRQQPS
jgi:methyltransferase